MSAIRASVPLGSAEVRAMVVRCGCASRQKQLPGWHGFRNAPCPRPLALEDKGVIAYWNRSFFKRARHRVARFFGRE